MNQPQSATPTQNTTEDGTQKTVSAKSIEPQAMSPTLQGHCSTHGLKFPIEGSCPLCLHGISTEVAVRSKFDHPFSSGVIGIVLVGLLLALTPASWIEKGLHTVIPLKKIQQQNADLALDTTRYQQEIKLLEAILYQPGKPQYFEAERIALFTEQLASAIVAKEEPGTARIAQKRLLAFADRTQQQSINQQGAIEIDLKAIQEDWAKVHASLFVSTDPSPTEAQASAPSTIPSQAKPQ